MKNTLFKNRLSLFSFLLLSLFATESMAQNTGWQWAAVGGGNVGSWSENTGVYRYTSEQILDIKIDNENNYYFLAKITQGNPHIDGTAVETYNNPAAGTGRFEEVVLLSTTADGTLRWQRIIGGEGKE